jgi:aldehyde:ferredoxin oxidoreductase
VLYRVRIEQFVVDQRAAQRQVGLGAFMGSHALAAVLGPDEPMAHGTGETELLVSQEAMLEHAVQLLLAMEARDRASQPDVDEEDGA